MQPYKGNSLLCFVVISLAIFLAIYDPVTKYAVPHYSLPPYFHSFMLPDGRQLSYAEYGQADGFPVFVLQSFLQARVGHSHELEAINRKHKMRIIVVDRPGYGASDVAPANYSALLFAHELQALADSLNITRFGLVGISAGGVYAMAAAHELSSKRLKVIVLLSPAGPDPVQGYDDKCKHTILDPLRALGYYLPLGVRVTMNVLRWWIFFWYPALAFPPEQMYWAFSQEELAHFVKAKVWDNYCDATLEALKPGVDGIINDLSQISLNWAFQIKDINRDPNNMHNIHIFHGSRDSIVPVGCAVHYSQAISGVKQLRVYPECGHGMMGNTSVWNDILTQITEYAPETA